MASLGDIEAALTQARYIAGEIREMIHEGFVPMSSSTGLIVAVRGDSESRALTEILNLHVEATEKMTEIVSALDQANVLTTAYINLLYG